MTSSTHDMTDEDAQLWSQQPSDGGVVRPSADEALPWSTTPIPRASNNTVYLVGCHGGAGVDTLAAVIAGTTAAGRAWPVRSEDDTASPLPVVLVARTSLAGLSAAQFALRQYATAGVPDGTELVGLVLIAASHRTKLSKAEQTKRRLITDGVTPLAPCVWDVKWHPELLSMTAADLPSWSVDDEAPAKRRPRSLASGVTADLAAVGEALAPYLTDSTSEVTVDAADEAQIDVVVEDTELMPTAVKLPAHTDEGLDQVERPRRSFPDVPGLPLLHSRKSVADEEDEAVTDELPTVDSAAEPVEAGVLEDPAWLESLSQGPVTRGKARRAVAQLPPLAGAPAPQRKKRRGWTIAAVVVVLGTLVTVLTVALLGGGQEANNADAPVTTAAKSPAPAPVEACPSGVTDGVTTGADAGDQRSGPAVIKAFNYAYYVTRSAKAAHAVAAEGALAPEDEMQKSLDQIPAGTTHCLAITERSAGLFFVELTQTPPGQGAPIVYRQLIRTSVADGKFWIASIKSAS